MKNRVFNLAFWCLIGLLIYTACSRNSAVSPTEVPSKPASTTMLLVPEDFPSQWKWSQVYSNQQYETPTPNNNFSTEYSFTSLIGYYSTDGIQSAFMISHMIRVYENSSPPSLKSVFNQAFSPGGFGELFSIDTVSVGKFKDCQCTNDAGKNNVFMCEIFVQYTSVESFLRITGNYGLGRQDIEDIVNQILLSVNDHIELEK